MKKRERSRRLFKIFIFIAVYMIIITALLPKATVAETVKTVKSSKAVTDVKIIYDDSYRTKDYTCWSGGYSSWTGTAYNNLNTVKNAGVIRRGTTFTFTGTGAGATTTIEVRGPTDSGSRPVVTGWNPTYAGGENWQLTIPKDAPVGDYQIYMDSEYCTLYVIFDVFLTKNPSGLTDNQFAGWAYDESSTADNYIPVLDNTGIATLNPFTERATEMAVSVLGGNTITPYEAGIKMYRVTNSRITWAGGATIPSLTEMLDQATALPVWEAKNVSLQTGYTLPSGMVLATGYQCTHFGYVTAGLARSLGIPSRQIHCKTIWEWNYHEWAELYIDGPGVTLAGGDSKWLVFDATDQNHNNGHDSAGESSIDTEKGYYYHSIKLSGTPATGSDGPQVRGWKGAGTGGATADWGDVNLDTAYTCADADIPTVSPSNTAEGDLGEGDRDFFRIDVSGVSTVDVVLVEGKEYAWLYVRKDAPVTASAIPGVKSNYVADANNTDAIIGLDVSTTNYLYVMIDNCKGDVEFQDNYWVGGRSETHHYVVGIGPGPYVKLNNPNGNETLVAGSSYIIEWEAVDVYNTSNSGALNINITYSTNSGLSYDYTIATNEANDGSYTWYIPNIESTNVRVKVAADDGVKINNDTSDDDFTIKPPDPLNEIVSGTGAFSGDWFGYSVSNLGDVNGDGYNDTIVGAPYNDFNAQDAGAAYIFFGRTTWSPGNLDAANADVKIYGTNANNHFGWSVSSAGNVNGDAYNDIIIGAPGNTSTVPGSAYIFYGRNTWNPTYNANNADVILNGGSNGDRFGFSVSDAGDVNNADNDDVIIGAPYNDSADGRWMDCGAAYIFYGDSGLTGTVSVTSADVNLTGATIFDYFGFSVSGAGDVNGDSYDDVIIGAPGADSAYIYYGSATMGSDFGVLGIKTYGYTGVTTAGPHDAYACDVDVFPFAGDAANRNTMVEATNAQYTAISVSDNTRWTTADPGALDEIFMWFEINGIAQNPADITEIDFTFEGYSALASDMKIYVMKAGADWTQDASWVQVDGTMSFGAGADSTMMVSLTSGFNTYIDATGKLVWGVYETVSSEALNVDYVKVDIKTECKANITLTGESTTNFGFSVSSLKDVNDDNYDDIVVGAPKYNNDQGKTYIFYGNTVMTTDPYVSETILFEDFDEGGAVPSGWDVSDWTGPAVAAQWHTTNDNARYGAIVSGTDYGMVSDSDQAGSGAMDAWLKSPAMDCSVYDKVQLQFAHVFNWISGYGVDTIYVYVATDGSVDSADYLVYSFTGADIALETKTFDISGYAAHQPNVKIGFRYTANYDMWWIIDDVVLTGKKPSSTTFITGEMPGDKFGYSVAWAGDINNDGINDTVIGAPYNDRTATDTGAIYVFYGNISISRSMCAGAADKINYGESANDNFGFSVSGVGDVNNDNYDDVIAGAPNTANGKAYVYSTQGGAADTEKPQISNVDDSPDPQETGGFVNITAVVTDNVGVSSVKVNISGPAGFTPVNVSMIKVSGTDTYYYNISYSLLGTYTYFVWAVDGSSNENSSITYTFIIQDTTKPEITNAQDTPDPQRVNGWINITVTVTDAVLDKVKVNISGPTGFIPVNTTMTKISGTDNYYYNTTYTVKGTYSYFIWANDSSNNENTSATYYFEIDNTPPEISGVNDNPDPQEVGGYVNITVTVADNMVVDSVSVNITDPNSDSVNVSMINVGGTDEYYYNTTYSILGDYSYFVWVNDTSDNGNVSSTNIFTIQDTIKPEISSVQANPDLETSGGYVNISAIVTDNYQVGEVWLNITYPDDSYENISITSNKTGSTFYCNKTYTMLGWYNYTIWANDTSNNWNNSDVYSFNITGAPDTDPPQISIPPTDSPDPQEVNNRVNITIYVSDNVLVSSVKVNISYPNGTLLGNFSMTGVGLDANGNGTYYYNSTYSEIGDYSYFIWAGDSSNNENATTSYTFTMQDTEKPGISSVQANPEEQETGGYVNISAVVTDNYQVDEVYLNITYPDSTYSNFSITQNLTGSIYYCNKTYTMLGWYNYTIWANDSSNNWNCSAIYSFNITVAPDTELPEITNVQDTPDPQEAGRYVNISATVTDNVGVSEVFLNITYPDSSYENISITQNKTGDTYYCNKTYSMLGEYSYLIWANDTSSNGNKSSAFTFDIVTIDYIVIEDAAGGTGNPIGEKNYAVTNTDTYYAIGYNYTVGYVKEVSCVWDSNNTDISTVSPAAGTSTTFTAVAAGTCYVRAENVSLGLSDITETITVGAKALKTAESCEKNNNKVSDNKNSPVPSPSLLLMFFVLPFGAVLSANTKGKFSKKMFIFVILVALIFSVASPFAISETAWVTDDPLTEENTGGGKSPDTVTLYPNGAEGAGTANTFETWVGGNPDAWQTNDGDTTYGQGDANNVAQTAHLDDTSLTGDINSVTVYAVLRSVAAIEDDLGILIYALDALGVPTAVEGTEFASTLSYATYSYTWNTNPASGVAWTWADINALEAGIDTDVLNDVRVTQVYVVVDYTPSAVDNPPVVGAYEPGGTSGQTYTIGDIITVKWNVTDDNPMPANNINISYGNASVGWTSIITNTANDETHDWDTSLATPGIYYINISAYDSISQESYDLGNFTFELVAVVDNPPTVNAYEPGGTSGQTYNIGDIVTVKWNATDDNPMPADNINISYGNATVGWISIVTNTANDETEPWDTSTATPGIYYINISAYDSIGQETYDLGNFTFVLWKIDYIVIENSAGATVGEMSFSATDIYMYYAKGYNITYGYSKDVNCVWGSNNTAVGTVTSPGTFTTFNAVGAGKCYVRAENVSLGLSDITKAITVTGAANNPPNQPTGLGVQGFVSGAGLIHITDSTPALNWTFSDPDGNDQGGYNVSVWNGSVGSGTLMWYKNTTGSGTSVTYGDGGEPTAEPPLGDGYCYNLSVEVNDTGGLWNTSDPLMFRMNTPPTAPTGTTNLGDYLIDHTPTVSWIASTDAEEDSVTYYVYVDTSAAPTTLEWSGTETTCELGNTVALSDGTTYYWRVKANDLYEDSSYAPDDNGDQFRMNTLPTLSNGAVNPTTGTTATTFTYNITYSDAEGDSPTSIVVYILKSGANISGSPFTMTWQSGSNTTGANYTYSTTLTTTGTDYTFYFNATDGTENATPTASTDAPDVITANNPPNPPTLTSPDNDTWTNNTPLFDWDFSDPNNDESRGYNITISNSSAFSTVDYWVNKSTTENITKHLWGSGGESSSPIDDGTWYWRVKVKDVNGAWSDWSGWRIIKIDTAAPTVTISVSDTVISDADAGDTFWVNCSFNENMNDTVTPTISFSPDVVTSGTLTFVSGVWNANDDWYNVSYTIADVDENQVGVDVSVSGGQDNAGNPQTPDPTTEVDKFDVDTVNPSVSSTYPNDGGTVNTLWYNVTVIFNEEMNISIIPTFESNFASYNAPIWNTNTKLWINQSAEYTDLTTYWLNITGGRDKADNLMNYKNFSFTVDTTAVDTAPPDSYVNTLSWYWNNTDTAIITATAIDAATGVQCVGLWYSYSSDNISWGEMTFISLDTEAPWEWNIDFTTLNSAGWYNLSTNATDSSSNHNEETVNYAGDVKCGYDATPPSNPTTTVGASPAVDTWSNDNTVDVTWGGHSDAPSGIAGFYYSWTTASDTVPTESDSWTTSTFTTSSALSDSATWYLHVRAKDNATNLGTGAYHIGPFKIDITPPSNPTSNASDPQINIWINDSTIYVSWYDATDALSGIAGYYYAWTTTSAYTPTISDNFTALTSNTSLPLGDNASWYLHVRAKDNASNLNASAYHIGPFKIDTTPPVTGILLIGTTGENGWNISNVIINLTAVDVGSGVDYIMYKIGDSNWNLYTGNITMYAEGSKIIYYYSVDKARNVEVVNSTTIKIDKSLPAISHTSLKSPQRAGPYNVTAEITDLPSGVNASIVKINASIFKEGPGMFWVNEIMTRIPGTNTYYYNLSQNTSQISPEDRDGARVTYYIQAKDYAGNMKDTTRYTFIIDLTPVTEDDITFSHYNARAGQNITIYVTIYKNETTPDNVVFRVIIKNPAGAEIYNQTKVIDRNSSCVVEAYDTVAEGGAEITDITGQKYLPAMYTIIVKNSTAPPEKEIDSQTATFTVVTATPPAEPATSFEFNLLLTIVAIAAVFLFLKRRKK